jgi:NAD(P)-dependent dehydrogenase (short-subunit alcohol dehydrogenase family)
MRVQGDIVVRQLDLADLQSVQNFSKVFLAEEKGPDLLILNAGIMACPQGYTKDGFEMQIGGHFHVIQPLNARFFED